MQEANRSRNCQSGEKMKLQNPSKEDMENGYFPIGCHENHVHVFKAEVLRHLVEGYRGELCNGIYVCDKNKIIQKVA